MASVPFGNANCSFLLEKGVISFAGMSSLPFFISGARPCAGLSKGTIISQCLHGRRTLLYQKRDLVANFLRKRGSLSQEVVVLLRTLMAKTPFGHTRKDVLLIGVGVTVIGIGLKSGLEFAGVDPLQAGNVVQLVVVLGLTIGWISTYIFRVSNKEMTYAQQLRDYEKKVMEKRLEGLTEAELEALLEQVEEEKRSISSGEQVK